MNADNHRQKLREETSRQAKRMADKVVAVSYILAILSLWGDVLWLHNDALLAMLMVAAWLLMAWANFLNE